MTILKKTNTRRLEKKKTKKKKKEKGQVTETKKRRKASSTKIEERLHLGLRVGLRWASRLGNAVESKSIRYLPS